MSDKPIIFRIRDTILEKEVMDARSDGRLKSEDISLYGFAQLALSSYADDEAADEAEIFARIALISRTPIKKVRASMGRLIEAEAPMLMRAFCDADHTDAADCNCEDCFDDRYADKYGDAAAYYNRVRDDVPEPEKAVEQTPETADSQEGADHV